MDSVEINQAEKKLEEAIDAELLLLSDASDPNGFFDIPMVDPRVGDEYQAEIPPMLTLSQLLELSTNPIESESTTENASCLFLLGLPMPITWICNDQPNTCKVDRASFFPVPGLSPESWSDFEVESFVLGLYVFGKNLLQVQRFMETKDVGQIQRYYYGTFYKSPRYCKWVDCRKMRNKKCVMGSKIFTGFRQHELLSRLLPYLSEEAKNTFQEISNALVEERTSLEEYVSSLKRMVGVRALVEAMRIGKGKEDLTTVITDNSKSGQRQRVRATEMPSGKACSSLTSADIIKFLTSDIRLSKARSNDLFWEAVWPRLLARGWHSEQPNDICTAPKNNLVFLMPGVKKFSRRKLVNGAHYFDSVSDVLRKVASEPRLLDLEAEEINDCAVDVHQDKDRPCYLKPQGVANVMKFTVIDTSLPSKVRELRSLPAEMKTSLSKRQSSHHDHLNNVPRPVKHNSEHALKRRRLKACSKAEKKPTIRRCSESAVRRQNFVLSLPALPKKAVRKSHSDTRTHRRVSPVSSIVAENHGERSCCSLATIKKARHQSQPLIDLNVPQVPAEPEANVRATDAKLEEGNVLSQNGSNGTNPHLENSEQDEQANGNARRQSTRIRPLSTRALEALESSFFNPKVGKKRSQAEDEKPKVSRRARSKTSDGSRDSESTRSDQTNDAAAEPKTMA